MRKVDKLGRIVIPLSLREKYGLNTGATIEFLDVGDGVNLRNAEACCKICRTKISDGSELPLCDSCVAEVVRLYNNKN